MWIIGLVIFVLLLTIKLIFHCIGWIEVCYPLFGIILWYLLKEGLRCIRDRKENERSQRINSNERKRRGR